MSDKAVLSLLCRYLSGSLNWNGLRNSTRDAGEVAAISTTHGLDALLFNCLHKESDGSAKDIRGLLKAIALEQTKRSLVQQADTYALAALLSENHIPFLLIKGAMLAHLYYPTLNLRPRADTDIFIDEKNIVATHNLLCQAGYPCQQLVTPLCKGQYLATQFNCYVVDKPGHSAFDMHWRINNSTALGSLLSFDEVYASSISAQGLGRGIRVPNTPYTLIIACIHWTGEPSKKLIWLHDIHVLNKTMESSNWEYVVDFAIKRKCISIISDVLEQTKRRFGTVFPPEILERLDRAQAGRPRERLQLLTQTPVSPLRSRTVDFLTLNWRRRLPFLWTLCFPPISYLALQKAALGEISIGDQALLYFTRPFRFLTRHFRPPLFPPPDPP